ncbi:hypothetical protein C8R45DRAFT_1067701 [Mycena sanguinolenta]|nr:hypothetical protein C8R45DRAFT_1067701 [Mycena sanguinolenta]
MHLQLSDNFLPDEIISEILSPALKVCDSDFSDTTSKVSPFANYSESSSVYLLVCKSWLRVATPLLYNVVVLRSKAQARALSIALSRNKELGQFIKKLRVEGGYGLPMHTILESSPNISDLFLTLKIYSSDNTSGLCKGLQLINPTRLILREVPSLENKMISQLWDALPKAILKWDRLCVFDCPFNQGLASYATKIIQPLVKFKRLHTVAIPKPSDVSWAYAQFGECPLKTIQIILKFTEKSASSELPLILPSFNKSFIPMASAPKAVHDKIWSRIFNPSQRRLAPLLVSKKFNNPSLGPHIHSLAIEYHDWEHRRVQTSRADDAQALLAVLSRTTGLVRLSQTLRSELVPEGAIPWDAFEAVAERTSSTLRDFSVRIETVEATSAAIFTKFASLRTLDWKCQASFLLTDIPEETLQNLEQLRISFATPSFLTVLSQMKLKTLRRVVLSSDLANPEIFLKVHGPKLSELDLQHRKLGGIGGNIFELCPNLCFISLVVQAGLNLSPIVHRRLNSIYPRDKDSIVAWKSFFLKFDPKGLPNLRELNVDCFVWPTNEREIAKTCWVPWAEILLKRKIDLTDKTGAKWRPRLKSRCWKRERWDGKQNQIQHVIWQLKRKSSVLLLQPSHIFSQVNEDPTFRGSAPRYFQAILLKVDLVESR